MNAQTVLAQQPNSAGPFRRRLVVRLAVLGLLARALIPVGYMPGNLLAGEFMVFCPAGGAIAAITDTEHRHHGDDGERVDVGGACPIGDALQGAALPAADPSTQPWLGAGAPRPRGLHAFRNAAPMLAFRSRAPPVEASA